tara:strand:+ start:468 stop:1331 length:864 start_codon:yes stop_codon:yes gene_type:complete
MSAWPANGVHECVQFSLYRSDDIKPSDTLETIQGKAVSKSMIVDFMDDPGAWKKSVRKETTASMSFGSLVDTLLLEESQFESRYALSPFPDFRSKAAQEWRNETEATGIQIITEDKLAMAHDACDAVRNHYAAGAILHGSRNQVAFRHKTKYRFASKGLIDIVPLDADTLVDLKTCSQSALESHRSLQYHIYDWSYHIQAGAYLEGWNIASGEERIRFKFIFVTNTAPFKVAVIEMPFAAIMLGAQQYRNGIDRFMDCMERNEWPSRWDGVVELDLPEKAYLEGGDS